MNVPTGDRPVALLIAFLAFLVLQRVSELMLASRNAARLRARGAREYGASHYKWLVILHTLFPIALATEVLALGARPGFLAPLWLWVWIAAQLLRYAAIRALGESWNTRILVVPGAPLVHHGVYRWLRHPNYVAVVLELLAAPLMFGAWRTALVFSLTNLVLLRIRIRCEEQALAGGSNSIDAALVTPPSRF